MSAALQEQPSYRLQQELAEWCKGTLILTLFSYSNQLNSNAVQSVLCA